MTSGAVNSNSTSTFDLGLEISWELDLWGRLRSATQAEALDAIAAAADFEFARQSLAAARLRFRPVLMTACSTLLGMVPLVIASGAGAAGRRVLGTAVFGGVVAATVLVMFFAPVFYVLMQRLSEWRSDSRDPTPTAELEARE